MHNNRNNNAKYVMRDSDSLTPVFQNKYLLFNLAWRDLNDLSGFKLRPSSFTGLSKENSCPAIDCKNAYKLYIVSEMDNGIEKLYAVAGIDTKTGKNLQPPANAPKFNLNQTSDNKYILSTSDNKYVAVNSTNEIYLTSDQSSSLSLDFNFITLSDKKPTKLINLVENVNQNDIQANKMVETPYTAKFPGDDFIFTLSSGTSWIYQNYNPKAEPDISCSLCSLPGSSTGCTAYCGQKGATCCPPMPTEPQPVTLDSGPVATATPAMRRFLNLVVSAFSVYTPPSPGPSPGPNPGPTPSSAPSDPTTLILAIGGGILGLVIISLIIYYAVQRGKTKQQALKTSTNTTNDSGF